MLKWMENVREVVLQQDASIICHILSTPGTIKHSLAPTNSSGRRGGGGRWTHLWASGAVPSINPTELWDINVPRLQRDSWLLSISVSKAALSLLFSILFCLEILNYGILLPLFKCLIGNLWVRWISLMMPVVTHMSNILRISQLPQSWLVKSMRR